MNNIGTQEIKTERLLLRKIKESDCHDLYKFTVKEEVAKYVSWTVHESIDVTRDLCKMWEDEYKKDNTYRWSVVYDGTVIGVIDVVKLINDSAFLGWMLDSTYWNKGIMTEAATAVRDYLFGKVQVEAMYAAHITVNIGSGRVMQKIGMKAISCEEYFAACDKEPKHELNGMPVSFYKMDRTDWERN